MFNNIIYFIVVLLIYAINGSEKVPAQPLSVFLAMLAGSWLLFAAVCRAGFRRLEKRAASDSRSGTWLPARYGSLLGRVSFLAVLLFTVVVYVFQLKGWLRAIPWFRSFHVLEGTAAISLFMVYLATIWFLAYPSSEALLGTRIGRKRFVLSHLRLNLPILFPWWVLTLASDVIEHAAGPLEGSFLGSTLGQTLFFVVFLMLLMTVMPLFIQVFWGCKPLEDSETARQLKGFLAGQGFRYRDLLGWPVFAGRLMTAGVMGIVPRFRYILVTDSLVKALSITELKAVLAHEMGHVKYWHLLFYLLFFVGFIVLFSSGFDLLAYGVLGLPVFSGIIAGGGGPDSELFYLFLAIPIVVGLLVYFRFLMGFFMRHFERQADLYSARVMDSPEPTISALEKIAYLSGRIRELPSWHHFSIRQRVDALWRSSWDPGYVKRHNRRLLAAILLYLVVLAGFGYGLHFSSLRETVMLGFLSRALNEELTSGPQNLDLRGKLAMVYQELGKEGEAMEQYRIIIAQDPRQATALNNLAWLLLTARDEALRDSGEALRLAERAAGMQRDPAFLDTLAEAYFANGFVDRAVETAKAALAAAGSDRGYFAGQLERFQAERLSRGGGR